VSEVDFRETDKLIVRAFDDTHEGSNAARMIGAWMKRNRVHATEVRLTSPEHTDRERRMRLRVREENQRLKAELAERRAEIARLEADNARLERQIAASKQGKMALDSLTTDQTAALIQEVCKAQVEQGISPRQMGTLATVKLHPNSTVKQAMKVMRFEVSAGSVRYSLSKLSDKAKHGSSPLDLVFVSGGDGYDGHTWDVTHHGREFMDGMRDKIGAAMSRTPEPRESGRAVVRSGQARAAA
jgi:hypothetical protein